MRTQLALSISVTAAILCSALLGVSLIYAQTSESLQTAPSTQLKQRYTTAAGTYRSAQQAFDIAKQENIQLQTLGTLETAVRAFREVQLARSQMIVNYFTALHAMVSEAKGMEIEEKDLLLQKLQTTIEEYTQHLAEIETKQDRVDLETTSATFAQKQDYFESLAYETIAQLRITAMQSALDQLQVTTEFLRERTMNPSQPPSGETQRGFDELGRTMDAVRTELAKANEFHDRLANDDNYGSSNYAQLIDMLNNGYPMLRQGESFLRELAGK